MWSYNGTNFPLNISYAMNVIVLKCYLFFAVSNLLQKFVELQQHKFFLEILLWEFYLALLPFCCSVLASHFEQA